ncbi:hypothetical protein ABI59_20620 [Acidobacteria bacterium Mor1]|nr:hypothetical protein ABI59_20620 [Acidobacteria bacterium Mor1]
MRSVRLLLLWFFLPWLVALTLGLIPLAWNQIQVLSGQAEGERLVKYVLYSLPNAAGVAVPAATFAAVVFGVAGSRGKVSRPAAHGFVFAVVASMAVLCWLNWAVPNSNYELRLLRTQILIDTLPQDHPAQQSLSRTPERAIQDMLPRDLWTYTEATLPNAQMEELARRTAWLEVFRRLSLGAAPLAMGLFALPFGLFLVRAGHLQTALFSLALALPVGVLFWGAWVVSLRQLGESPARAWIPTLMIAGIAGLAWLPVRWLGARINASSSE